LKEKPKLTLKFMLNFGGSVGIASKKLYDNGKEDFVYTKFFEYE